MSSTARDIVHTLRGLRRSPGFALTVVLTLAVAFGINILAFAVIHEVLIRPLPFRQPEDLVIVWATQSSRNIQQASVSLPDFADLARDHETLAEVAAMRRAVFVLRADGEPEEIRGAVATPNLFQLFGVQAAAGQLFRGDVPAEEVADQVLISEALWQRRFGGELDIAGRELVVDERSVRIAGVVPSTFRFPSGAEIWLPLTQRPEAAARGGRYYTVFGRLPPASDVGVAQQRANRLAAALEARFSQTNQGWRFAVLGLQEQMVARVRQALWIIYGCICGVMLLAWVNVGSICSVRAGNRLRELAVREACGAGRGQILGLLLIESLILAALASVLGVLLASWGRVVLGSQIGRWVPLAETPSLQPWMWVYGLGLVVAATVVCGLLPALRLVRRSPSVGLLRSGHGATGDSAQRRFQNGTVVAQVAIVVPLLICTLFSLKSVLNLANVDVGFEFDGVTTMKVALKSARYEPPAARLEFFRQLQAAAARLPDTEAASLASDVPLAGSTRTSSFHIEDQLLDFGETPSADIHSISHGYFATMRIPLTEGRAFTPRDRADSQGVAVVNQALARRYWGEAGAIGKSIRIGGPKERRQYGGAVEREIVGVVADVKHRDVTGQVRGEIYVPYEQGVPESMVLTVRSQRHSERLVSALKHVVHQIDELQPAGAVEQLETIYRSSFQQERIELVLFGILSVIAVLLTSIGLYGLTAYTIERRSLEIGIRLSLGARPAEIARLILASSLKLGACGVGLGLLITGLVVKLLTSRLYGVGPFDPLIFSASLALVAVMTCAATLGPVSRLLSKHPISLFDQD